MSNKLTTTILGLALATSLFSANVTEACVYTAGSPTKPGHAEYLIIKHLAKIYGIERLNKMDDTELGRIIKTTGRLSCGPLVDWILPANDETVGKSFKVVTNKICPDELTDEEKRKIEELLIIH